MFGRQVASVLRTGRPSLFFPDRTIVRQEIPGARSSPILPAVRWLLVFLVAGCGSRSSLLPIGQDDQDDGEQQTTSTSNDDDVCYSVCKCATGSTFFLPLSPNADGTCSNVCDATCADQGGVEDSLSSTAGLGRIPYCDELCTRFDALGCSASCRELIGDKCRDVDLDDCSLSINLSFQCLATNSEMFCDAEGVRIEFCSTDELAFCEDKGF